MGKTGAAACKCVMIMTVLKMNGGAVYIIPTVLELSHAYVSVSASNEINRLVIVLISPS